MGLLHLVVWLIALLACARADFVGQYLSGSCSLVAPPRCAMPAYLPSLPVLGVTPTGAAGPVVAVASYDVLNGFLRFDPAVGGVVAAYKATSRVFTGEYLSTAIVNGK